jgi:WD40 repeat protein
VLASSSDNDPTVSLWDVGACRLAATLTLPDVTPGEGVLCLAFGRDGKRLFTGGERGIEAWDVSPESRVLVHPATSTARQERATLRGHAGSVRSLAVVSSGRSLVSRGEDGVIKVWDLDHAQARLTLGGGDSRVRCMGLTPDGRLLAAGIRAGGSRASSPPRQGDLSATDVFQPPAEAEANKQTQKPQAPRVGAPPQAAPPAAQAAPPPVEAKVWSLGDGHERATLSGHNGEVVALDFGKDGKLLASTSRAGVVKLWDTATFKPVSTLTDRQGGVDLVLFSADNKTLIGASAAGLVTLWDVGSGKVRASFSHFGGMNTIVLAPDGKTLATGGGRVVNRADASPGAGPAGDVRIWDLATGRRLAVLPVPSGQVTRLAFSPDGKTLASATAASSIMLWDVASSSPRGTLSWLSGRALFLAFAPDGKALVSGGEDDVLRLWDAASGRLIRTLHGHADAIDWIAFLPDGRTVLTASRDMTVKLWNAALTK